MIHGSLLAVERRLDRCISYRSVGGSGIVALRLDAKQQGSILRNHPYGNRSPLTIRRNIQTEREYIPLADSTLETIQDAVDSLFDRQTMIEYEVSLSSGVLTMKFPPHGTWVINKQTPNLQLWVRRLRR
jgi:Frataxin-like domain